MGNRETALKNLAKARKVGGGGRKKGTLNRFTRLQNAILDAVNDMDPKGAAHWIKSVAGSGDKEAVAIIKVAASLIPKQKFVEKRKYSEVNVTVNTPSKQKSKSKSK